MSAARRVPDRSAKRAAGASGSVSASSRVSSSKRRAAAVDEGVVDPHAAARGLDEDGVAEARAGAGLRGDGAALGDERER
jgi:hypothetical protein